MEPLSEVPELHPTEEEFKHPIKYLSKPEISILGEEYGILKVIPPENWKPQFSLDWNTFKFHTRIQNLHELNLRNRSRACFVEGFNCYLQSIGNEPIKISNDLCFGVSNDFQIKKSQLKYHLNGWLELKDSSKVHIHDIFLSKEFRKWFYKINDFDKDFLKKLILYSKKLLSLLGLNDDDGNNNNNNNIKNNDLIIPCEFQHTTLSRLMISPASLLAQPENLKQLKRMKTRISNFKRTKRRKLNNDINEQNSSLLTPPVDNSNFDLFNKNIEKNSQFEYPLTPDLVSPDVLDETCIICHNSENPESTLLCDGCSRAFHMKCLTKPLIKIPKYDWFCNECLVGSTSIYSDYGFEEEFDKKFSLNEFSKYCNEWEIEFLNLLRNGNLGIKLNLKNDEILNKLSEDTIEKVFWYLTNGKMNLPNNLKIRYGADIHCTKPGEISGFPSIDNPRINNNDLKYLNDEWNLIKLPFAKGSLLDYICNNKKEQISGMSIPWLYVGGTLSTFCWHKEDHYTLSANYSHLGSPKKWYGIPSKYAENFENLINKIAPEFKIKQKDLMHQLVSMISPNEINKSINNENDKIKIFETIQRPGEFIITFPKVYHSGFNYGFNVNEAVNFTLPLWVPYSVSAVEEYEKVGKECVFETFGLLRKIINDLNTIEGKNSWMNNTGINEDQIEFVLKWAKNKYNEEINKFSELLNNEKLRRYLSKMEHIKLESFNEKGETKIYQGNKEKKEGKEDEDEDEYEIDDKLCRDCKTRVHFQWILVDLYKDCLKQLNFQKGDNNKEIEKNKYKENILNGLGIKLEEENKNINKHKDIESEWKEIIQRAKSEEIEDKNEIPNRRSSRRIKKRKEIILIDEETNNVEEKNKDNERKEIINSLIILKKENQFFGKCVFCFKCFLQEMERLDVIKQERVIEVSNVIEQYNANELYKI